MTGVLILLAVLALAAVVAAGYSWWGSRQYGVLAGGHAHNDYRRRHPLRTALRYGYTSVEVDVWPVDGRLLVGHDAEDLRPGRTLRALYLEPLAERFDAHGFIQPGLTEPFQLLIEVKADRETAWELLDRELTAYQRMLTRFDADGIQSGAVTVVITGKPPRTLLAGVPTRYAACDGSLADVGSDTPPSLVPLCSEQWSWKFTWTGRGPMPEAERALLRRLVAGAHEDGRKVRFWGVPARPRRVRHAMWREMHAAGVDYLGADELRSLRSFLRRGG